jgi:hypothetical protein
MVSEPKPDTGRQKDHRQFYYSMGDKGEKNKKKTLLLAYQI